MSVRDLLLSSSFMFLTSLAFSQTNLNWNITGAGARAEGLGGAFIGVADDATAIVWNPAGLTQLERAELSAVGRYSSEKSESKSNVPGYEYDESNSQSHYSFNFASGAVPLRRAPTISLWRWPIKRSLISIRKGSRKLMSLNRTERQAR